MHTFYPQLIDQVVGYTSDAKRVKFISRLRDSAFRLKLGSDWPGSGSHARSDQRAAEFAKPKKPQGFKGVPDESSDTFG
jgi:hypothetical protein